MRKLPLATAAAVACLLIFMSAAAPALGRSLDEAVLDEINFARTRPREYARELERERIAWRGQLSERDPGAAQEAIDFLLRQRPLPPLRWDDRLAGAALDHALAQGPRGGLGHTGPRGETLGQRLQRRGVWAGMSAENISYGHDSPAAVVRQLIVDEGVPSRGHRLNIFGSYQAAGVGCGRHAAWGAMCVIDFAGAIMAR